MTTTRLLPLFGTLLMGLVACKVTVGSGASPDEARQNGTTEDVQEGAEAGAEAETETGEDGESPSEGGTMGAGNEFAGTQGSAETGAEPTCPEGVSAGESFKIECNSCRCTDDGQALCTRMACTGTEVEEQPQ